MLHYAKKYFLSLQAFITEEILKCDIKECFKINGKKMIPNKCEYIKSKNLERKTKSPFTSYANFEIILVPEENGKQNPEVFYTSKYRKHVACSYDY